MEGITIGELRQVLARIERQQEKVVRDCITQRLRDGSLPYSGVEHYIRTLRELEQGANLMRSYIEDAEDACPLFEEARQAAKASVETAQGFQEALDAVRRNTGGTQGEIKRSLG